MFHERAPFGDPPPRLRAQPTVRLPVGQNVGAPNVARDLACGALGKPPVERRQKLAIVRLPTRARGSITAPPPEMAMAGRTAGGSLMVTVAVDGLAAVSRAWKPDVLIEREKFSPPRRYCPLRSGC